MSKTEENAQYGAQYTACQVVNFSTNDWQGRKKVSLEQEKQNVRLAEKVNRRDALAQALGWN